MGWLTKEKCDADGSGSGEATMVMMMFCASETSSMFLYCRLRRLSFRAFDEIRKRSSFLDTRSGSIDRFWRVRFKSVSTPGTPYPTRREIDDTFLPGKTAASRIYNPNYVNQSFSVGLPRSVELVPFASNQFHVVAFADLHCSSISRYRSLQEYRPRFYTQVGILRIDSLHQTASC